MNIIIKLFFRFIFMEIMKTVCLSHPENIIHIHNNILINVNFGSLFFGSAEKFIY
jgi:hypothetical protein